MGAGRREGNCDCSVRKDGETSPHHLPDLCSVISRCLQRIRALTGFTRFNSLFMEGLLPSLQKSGVVDRAGEMAHTPQ